MVCERGCLLNKERKKEEESRTGKMKACFSVCLVDQIDFLQTHCG